jgi:hypothetical protein
MPCLELKAACGSNLFVGHRQNPKEEREALAAGGGGARGNAGEKPLSASDSGNRRHGACYDRPRAVLTTRPGTC